MNVCDDHANRKYILQNELQQTRGDIHRLQEEITFLKRKVNELRDCLCDERKLNKMSNRKLEDTIRSHENEKRNILSKQDELLRKIHMFEQTVECMNKKVQEVIGENKCWQSKFNELRQAYKRLECAKRNAEKCSQDFEQSFRRAQCQIKSLEEEKRKIISDFCAAKSEVQSFKQKYAIAEKDRENLMDKLGSKTCELQKCEMENSKKYHIINEHEEKISLLNCELLRSTNDESMLQKELTRIKTDLHNSLEEKKKCIIENKKLCAVLECAKKDFERKKEELHRTASDLAKSKEKIRCYCEKFKKMEGFLAELENGRKILNHEIQARDTQIINLESSLKNMENEYNSLCNNNHVAEEKLKDLQMAIETKDRFKNEMENKLRELTCTIQQLKDDLSKCQQKNTILRDEKNTSRELIKSLECQKRFCETELDSMNSKLECVKREILKSKSCIKELTCQLELQKWTIASLEREISDSRKEAREDTLHTMNVNQKVQELQTSMDKLQDKLCGVNKALSNCQKACTPTKCQNNEFSLVNEQYAQALAYDPCCKSSSSDDVGKDRSCDCLVKNMSSYDSSRRKCKETNTYDCGGGYFSMPVNKCHDGMRETEKSKKDPICVEKSSSDDTSLSNKIFDSKNDNFDYLKYNFLSTSYKHGQNKHQNEGSSSNPFVDTSKIGKTVFSKNKLFDSDPSELSSAKFLSIIEEGPTYRVAKKCYKKIGYSESEDDCITKGKQKL